MDRGEQKRGPRLNNLDLLRCTRILHRYLRQDLNNQNRQSKGFVFKTSLPPGPLKLYFPASKTRFGRTQKSPNLSEMEKASIFQTACKFAACKFGAV